MSDATAEAVGHHGRPIREDDAVVERGRVTVIAALAE